MSNQPPRGPRTLFRLPTIARPTAPVPTPNPAPAPEPRPPMLRPASRPWGPTFQQPESQEPTPPPSAVVSPASKGSAIAATLPAANNSLLPSSPTPGASASLPTSPAKVLGTSSSVPTSLAEAASTQTSSTTKIATFNPIPSATIATARVPSPIHELPKTIEPIVQTLTQSPKSKPAAPPQSALTILPSQFKSQRELEQKIPMEVRQKDVEVRKKEISKENEIKEMVKSTCKNILGPEEVGGGMRVITITGENRGAFMKLIQSAKKHDNPKTKGHGNDSESSGSSDEAKRNDLRKDKNHKGNVTSSMPMRGFVNSNVQSINNSMLYNCTCTHHDPGVHLALSRN